jgi:hypothetical protein
MTCLFRAAAVQANPLQPRLTIKTRLLLTASLPELVIECCEHEVSRHREQPAHAAHDLDHDIAPVPKPNTLLMCIDVDAE